MKRNNNKIRRFVAEYLKDQNGTQAAIRAGYSKRTANEQAARLLTKVSVKKKIESALRKAEAAAGVTIADTLRKISRLADSDIRELFNDDGSLKNVKDWPDEIALSVSSVEVDELFEGTGRDREQVGETKKVKLWDKVKALEMLGRHLKMFTDKTEISMDKKSFDLLEESIRRGNEISRS